MTDPRQMPLSGQIASVADLNRHTPLRDSISVYQMALLRDGKSQHTIKAFTSDLQLLGEYGGETTPLGDFTTTRLNEFLQWLEVGRGVPCSRKSYARRVTTLKAFFKWLNANEVLGSDPAKPVLQRSGPAPLSHVLMPAQVDACLAHTGRLRVAQKPDARPELLFRLQLETGIKKSETMKLTPNDFDRLNPKQPYVNIRHKGAKDPYRERRIPVSPELVAVLDEYLAQYTPKETIFNCTARNLEYVLEDVGVEAGIPFKLSFEIMRWTNAVRNYRAGMEPTEIRDRLGLSPVSWTETFAKVKRLTERQLQDEDMLAGKPAPVPAPEPEG
jgi:site-specific recombinase XerD